MSLALAAAATVTNLNNLPSGTYGAMWLATDENGDVQLFTYKNENGNIYRIDNFTTSPTTGLIASSSALGKNDGMSCPEAPVPDFPIKAVDDSDVTDVDFPVDVNWIDNDDLATDGAFALSMFDTTSANGGTITDNGDGTFHYTPPAGFTGVDTFTYKICLTGIVGEPICDTATVTITIVSPKLNVTKDAEKTEYNAGDQVKYTITYSNTGDGVANNATLTETVPANTTYSGDASEGWACQNGGVAGSTCIKQLGNLAVSQAGSAMFTVTIDSTIEAPLTEITNTVVLDADNADPINANAIINVKSSAKLNVDKNDKGAYAEVAGNIVYTITYSNSGTMTESEVYLTETVPANTTYTGMNEGWVCENGGVAGSTCVYTVGDLAPGANGEVMFTVMVNEDTSTDVSQILNTVTISGDSGENQASDDEDTPLENGDVLGEIIYNNSVTSTPVENGDVLGEQLANTGEFALGMLPFAALAMLIAVLSAVKRKREQEA